MEAMKHNNISSFVGMYITQKVYTPEWNRMEHQAMLTAISKARKWVKNNLHKNQNKIASYF